MRTLLLLLLFTSTGCATIRVTDPARTATEQFLMSQAITQAISQLNLDSLRDRKIWIDAAYLTGTEQFTTQGELRQRIFSTPEQAFATAELREKLLIGGARLVQDKKDAEIIVEVRSGAIGVDRLENLIGIPAGVLQGVNGPGGLPLVTPELALYKNTRQRSFASIAFVA